MKSKIINVTLIGIVILLISAIGVVRIRDVQGDKSGDPSLRQKLINVDDSITNRYTKTQSDAKYVTNIQLDTSSVFGYSNAQIDSLDNAYMANDFRTLKSLGSTIQNMPVGASFRVGLGATLTDGVIELQLQWPRPYVYTIDTLMWVQYTAGVYTGDNENRAGVYSYNKSTDTYTLVASIANDANLWTTTSGGLVTKVLATPYTTTANEIIYTAVLYNQSAQTTGPSLMGSNINQSNFIANEFLGTKYLIEAQKTGQTTLAASFTGAIRVAYCPLIIVR